MKDDSNSNLNPGSKEAVEKGCTCPTMDNGHGEGSGYFDENRKPLFWITVDCPLHSKEKVNNGTIEN